ncbi:flavin reductase [Candidatus Woesearchaeota archaeon]|nr:flavin reductase [Candidatus Woesearchaeota archaeon]
MAEFILLSCRGSHTHIGKTHDIKEVVPINNFMTASTEPLVYAISLNKDLIATKMISETKIFALNFLSEKFKEAVVDSSKHTGEFHDKLSLINLTEQPTEKILDCFSIKEAEKVLECEVIHEFSYGDSVVFFGKALN